MKPRLLLLLAGGALALILAACAPEVAPTLAPTPPPAATSAPAAPVPIVPTQWVVQPQMVSGTPQQVVAPATPIGTAAPPTRSTVVPAPLAATGTAPQTPAAAATSVATASPAPTLEARVVEV